MASRFLAMGCIAVLSAGGSAAVSDVGSHRIRAAAASGAAQLRAFGGRSAEQRRSPASGKFDGALADLSRHAALANPSRVLADLHSTSPAARFKLDSDGASPLVAIDA